MIQRGLRIPWGATAEVKHVGKWSDELIQKMAKSGCFGLFLGAESASAYSIELTEKNYDPEDTPKAVKRLSKVHIASVVSYIAGMPGERPQDIKATIDQACLCRTLDPECESGIRPYLPLDGTVMGDQIPKDRDIFMPERIEDYGRWTYYSEECTNLRFYPKMLKLVNRVMNLYFHWGFNMNKRGVKLGSLQRFLGASARFRVQRRFYALPIEFWLYGKFNGIRKRVISWSGKVKAEEPIQTYFPTNTVEKLRRRRRTEETLKADGTRV